MTDDKKQRLGIQDWTDSECNEFKSAYFDALKYEGVVSCVLVATLEGHTGKTFEEIQTIMEGE